MNIAVRASFGIKREINFAARSLRIVIGGDMPSFAGEASPALPQPSAAAPIT